MSLRSWLLRLLGGVDKSVLDLTPPSDEDVAAAYRRSSRPAVPVRVLRIEASDLEGRVTVVLQGAQLVGKGREPDPIRVAVEKDMAKHYPVGDVVWLVVVPSPESGGGKRKPLPRAPPLEVERPQVTA